MQDIKMESLQIQSIDIQKLRNGNTLLALEWYVEEGEGVGEGERVGEGEGYTNTNKQRM